MNDRRRVNGPPGGTRPPVYASLLQSGTGADTRAQRQRQPSDLRKICMQRRAAFPVPKNTPANSWNSLSSPQDWTDSFGLGLLIP